MFQLTDCIPWNCFGVRIPGVSLAEVSVVFWALWTCELFVPMQGGHVVVQVELTLQFLATDVAYVMLLPIDIS